MGDASVAVAPVEVSTGPVPRPARLSRRPIHAAGSSPHARTMPSTVRAEGSCLPANASESTLREMPVSLCSRAKVGLSASNLNRRRSAANCAIESALSFGAVVGE
ncbi:hypothetical protein D3C87_1515070 [compost metagenome]